MIDTLSVPDRRFSGGPAGPVPLGLDEARAPSPKTAFEHDAPRVCSVSGRRLLMRPAIAPPRVYAHAWRPGDLVIFDNRGPWHSVVGSPSPTELRIYHQCNLASNEPPSAALQ